MSTSLVYIIGFAMILVGAGFLYLLLRNNEGFRPRDIVEGVGAGLSVLLIISASGLLIVAASAEDSPALTVRDQISAMEDVEMDVPAPEFTFSGLHDGEERTLADYRGKVVLVNFWATWCVPCLTEIPDLNELSDRYRDEGLVVISISDEDAGTLRAFEQQLPMETESMIVPLSIQLPQPFSGALVLRPATFIVDRKGVVRRFLLGARSLEFFESAVDPLLREET